MLVVYKEIDALFQEVKGFRFVPRVGRNPYNQNALSVSTNLYQWFSDLPHAYPFSKNHWNPLKAHAFPPKLAELKKVETSQNSPFNSVLVNYYPDGKAKLSAHSDNDPWLGPIFDVPSVSIGASRKILFRPKSKNVTIPTSWNGRKVFEVDMKSGSLLAMKVNLPRRILLTKSQQRKGQLELESILPFEMSTKTWFTTNTKQLEVVIHPLRLNLLQITW